MTKVEVLIKCQECEDFMDAVEENFVCRYCYEKLHTELIKDAAREAIIDAFEYRPKKEDKTHYVGFSSEEDKKSFLLGLRSGYREALFWICDSFDIVEFFEQLNKKDDSK